MVRSYAPEERERKSFLGLLGYWLAVVLIIIAWIAAFRLYFERYDNLHPDITWAKPGTKTYFVKVPGVLLWREEPVVSPSGGAVSFPSGTGPVVVGKNQLVAVVNDGVKSRSIRASETGFFIAGRDGEEEKWIYSELWSGKGPLAEPSALVMMKNGQHVGAGEIIGKVVVQPQELRFIGYAEPDGDFDEQLKNRRLRVMMDKNDTISRAELRVSKKANSRVKIYVTMPWMNGELLKSRKYTLTVEAGKRTGVLVPAASVRTEKGRQRVFLVKGQRLVSQKIEGVPVENGMILVTKGLTVGDAIAADASEAREGRIQLW